jgi:hypothetical protein
MGATTAILADADGHPGEVLRGRPTLDRAAALNLSRSRWSGSGSARRRDRADRGRPETLERPR